MKVAGSVVLYNSSFACIDVIQTYYSQIDRLFVIDNSDIPNKKLVEALIGYRKIQYIANNGNQGIANALNRAASLALADGYTYLLTMDDDSMAPPSLVSEMLNFLNEYTDKERVGIISVAHSQPESKSKSYKKVPFTMTSGNLLNLDIYKIIGEFREDFFIDHVDHEYALRLKIHNYDIIELANLKLFHNLGILKKVNLFSYSISFVSHSPTRLYYLVRNGIYIIRKYFWQQPNLCLLIFALNFKESLKSMLLEDEKLKRLFFVIKAIKDGIIGKLGKIYD